MADVITRLKVDSKEYDSKIKRAESGLLSLENSLKKAGKDFTQADKSAVQFARDLGKMETVSRSARGKVGELSTAFIDLSSQYKRLTDAEKQSPFGKAMAKSLDELKQRVRAAKSELDQFQGELNNTTRKGGNLGGMIDGIAGRFGMSSQMFTAAGAAVAGAGLAFKLAGDNIRTALNFEKSMSMLSSLTGKTGQDLETLKEYAIELGSTSTLTASQVADAFRLIGSQQPQLLESSEALKEVTKNAITLSEAAGIELATAAQTLSVSVNQMGGDSSNAARFVNVLAAASQKGAGDIAWLGEAITKSGTTAKAVGTSYEELVANLEQLAKAGYDASTAGTALRSIIMNLEKKASNEFKPSIVGLTQAFENLGKANLTLTEYQEMAGKMFAAQAKALAEAAGEAKNMKEQITGTNIAEEQAKTNTDNLDGALKGLSSAWEGLNLHINSSNGVLKVFIDWCASTIRSLDSMATAAGRAKRALLAMNGGEGGAPTAVDKQISALQGSGYKKQRYTLAVGSYDRQIADLQTKIDNGGKWESSTKPGFYHYESTKVLQARLDALKQMRNEYVTRAKAILNPQKMKEDIGPTGLDEVPGTTSGGGKKGKGGKGGGVTHVMTEEQTISKQIQTLTNEYISAADERKAAIRSEIATLQERQKVIQQMKDEALGKVYTPVTDVSKPAQGMSVMGSMDLSVPIISVMSPLEAMNKELERTQELMKKAASPEEWALLAEHLDEVKNRVEDFKGNNAAKKQAKDAQDMLRSWQAAAGAVSSVGGALQQIEDPTAKILGIIAQAVANVALGFAQATAAPATTSAGVFGWIAAAVAGTATMISTIAAIKSATSANFAQGGIVPGSSYSGDNIRAYGLNSGELILSMAQQNTIADRLTSSPMDNLNLSATIDAEQIRLVLNNRGRRTGRGEYVQTKFG